MSAHRPERISPERYDDLLRLADAYDDAGARVRAWAELGPRILEDPDVVESAPLSPRTWNTAEDAIRNATVGKHGLLSRSLELDADALVLRATVMTYRWIDDLQSAAYETLGSIAGRAIGYLAPQVELGGAVVAAGLIETEALDRDGMAAYLGELARANPDLMEHVTTGGGLAESLQVRALLTSSALADNAAARHGGLAALGLGDFPADLATAVRDAAAGAEGDPIDYPAAQVAETAPPSGLAEILRDLHRTAGPLGVRRIGRDRAIVLLPACGPDEDSAGRLVAGQPRLDALEDRLRAALDTDGAADDVRLLLAGAGSGGTAALELARSGDFAVDQVITANAPTAHLHGVPDHLAVLSFDHRTNPVALLGSIINARDESRLTILCDGDSGADLVAAADRADHLTQLSPTDRPALEKTLTRLRTQGYLA